MSKRTGSNMRYTATIIISYLLSLFLVVLISFVILLRTVFSPEYMVSRVDSSEFTATTYAAVQEIYISHGTASGVSTEMMQSLITPEDVDDAIKAEIRAAYKTGSPFDYTKLENEMFAALHNYAVRLGFEATDELDEAIRDLAKLCAGDFKKQTASMVIGMIGTAATRFERYITIGITLSAIVALLLIMLLPILNRRISRWVSGYIYAFGATAIICAAIPIVLFISGFTQRLNITPQAYNDLLRSWIEGVAHGYLTALIPVLIILTTCIIVWIIRRIKRRKGGAPWNKT